MLDLTLHFNPLTKKWVITINKNTYFVEHVEFCVPCYTVIDQFRKNKIGEAYLKSHGIPVIRDWEYGLKKIVVIAENTNNEDVLVSYEKDTGT